MNDAAQLYNTVQNNTVNINIVQNSDNFCPQFNSIEKAEIRQINVENAVNIGKKTTNKTVLQ